jgi:hypothetical protein
LTVAWVSDGGHRSLKTLSWSIAPNSIYHSHDHFGSISRRRDEFTGSNRNALPGNRKELKQEEVTQLDKFSLHGMKNGRTKFQIPRKASRRKVSIADDDKVERLDGME